MVFNNIMGFGGKVKRGGKVNQKIIFDSEGRGGVQTPPKKDDIICEQPLMGQNNCISCRRKCVGTSGLFVFF